MAANGMDVSDLSELKSTHDRLRDLGGDVFKGPAPGAGLGPFNPGDGGGSPSKKQKGTELFPEGSGSHSRSSGAVGAGAAVPVPRDPGDLNDQQKGMLAAMQSMMNLTLGQQFGAFRTEFSGMIGDKVAIIESGMAEIKQDSEQIRERLQNLEQQVSGFDSKLAEVKA